LALLTPGIQRHSFGLSLECASGKVHIRSAIGTSVLAPDSTQQSRSRHRLVRIAKEAPDIKGDTRATAYTHLQSFSGSRHLAQPKQKHSIAVVPVPLFTQGSPSVSQLHRVPRLHLHPPFPPRPSHTTPPSCRPGRFSTLVAAAAAAAPLSSSEKQSTSLSLGPRPPLPGWCPYTFLHAAKRRSARGLHSPLPLQQVKAKKRPGQTRPGRRQTERTLSPSFLRSLAGWLSVATIHLSPLFPSGV
jgi:hypothetical protein